MVAVGPFLWLACNMSSENVWEWSNFLLANTSTMLKMERLDEALQIVSLMHHQGMPLSRDHLYSIAQKYSKHKDLAAGRRVHSLLVSSGLDALPILEDHCIRLFASCGSLLEAALVFCKASKPTIYTWHAIVSAHSLLGEGERSLELYRLMWDGGIKPDKVTFLSILRTCGCLRAIGQGMVIHDQIIRRGLVYDDVIGNALLDMYVKGRSLEEAQAVFDRMPNKDVVSWTMMIVGYAQQGYNLGALELYEKMQQKGIKPDKVVCSSILKVCGNLGAIEHGKLVYGKFIISGLELDVIIGNSLVDMYAKCGSLKEARRVFDAMSSRDVVSWSTIIAGYAEGGHGLLALELFNKMLQAGIKPDRVTFLCSLKGCVSMGDIDQGKLLHEQLIQNGFDSNLVLGNTLIDMYLKCENLKDACRLFNKLQTQDLVSWNAIISGYVQQGYGASAIAFFDRMQLTGIKPNKVTFLCILKACTSTGVIRYGNLMHNQILIMGLESDMVISNTLIDMYAKCGSLEEAQRVFSKLPTRDAGSWGAMVAASAQHGNCKLAVHYLEAMRQQGLKPLDRTCNTLLTAYSHAGLVEEGCCFFKSMMQDHGIIPNLEHFNCMIDLLGRAGCLKEAEELLQTLPIPPDVTGWTSVLAACKTYSNTDLGKRCFDQVAWMHPNVAVGYVLMSNIYTDYHMSEQVQKVEDMRKSVCAWKRPGIAWIEIDSKVLQFTVGDIHYLQNKDIHIKSKRLGRFMEQAGYVPLSDIVLEPSSYENKNDGRMWRLGHNCDHSQETKHARCGELQVVA